MAGVRVVVRHTKRLLAGPQGRGTLGHDMTETDPLRLFIRLYGAAKERESFDASRAALATVGADGFPAVRFVLVKNLEQGRFDVFTHLGSPKARDMRERSRAALAFHWSSTGVQVRVRGAVSQVPEAEADAYFASRPRGSQLGAWASRQSEALDDRDRLLSAVAERSREFEGRAVPRPPFWGGLRIDPERIEVWHNRDDRLHDRYAYQRQGDTGPYVCTRLYP